MSLLDVVAQVVAVVVGLHAVGLATVVGRERLRSAVGTVRSNLAAVRVLLAVLVGVLALNRVVRNAGIELSWIIGLNITGPIHALEGQVVSQVQSAASPPLTAYFGFVYVFGYAFLLTFPLVAYALWDDPRPLRSLLVAYVVNYSVGLVCYVAFVAYGPRNFMPELVEPLLYTSWPQSQLLTSQVNTNTNVFPSLHTSLSLTVALLAYRFRAVYPRWMPVAGFLAGSIAVSTMYLGIHWLTDVLAGMVVAVLSVAVAARVQPRRVRRSGQTVTERLARVFESVDDLEE